MKQKISVTFSTRRDAELAVEHLVQEHGVARADISVGAAGEHNTAGSKKAGADLESGHGGTEKRGEPKLDGDVEVSVACGDHNAEMVRRVLKDAGKP